MLEIISLCKKTENFNLRNIYLTVEKGDYWIVLGNSGAGKTLFLELLCGLVKPKSGKILFENKKINTFSIQKRPFGIVFEDYAIFPHMSVRNNIAYPIRNNGLKRQEIIQKVAEVAGLVSIAHLLNRNPSELSRGELQRVAIARTLAKSPEILLLDQPLSSLDVQLRGDLRRVLRSLNQKGQTIIHVTQEYEEAIALANKVAVLNDGRIIQSGPINEVFSKPKSQFVANFIGINNYFPAQITGQIDNETRRIKVSELHYMNVITKSTGGFGFILIKDENIKLSEPNGQPGSKNNYRGTIIEISRSKYGYNAYIDIGLYITALVSETTFKKLNLIEGKAVWVSIEPENINYIPT